MFPIDLKFTLTATTPAADIDRIVRGRFPDLQLGTESDLMKDAREWPEAVVVVRQVEETGGTEVEFLVFPRMATGQDPVMVPTKIALMRAWAREFECGVVADTSQFAIPDTYHRREEFLCRAGRFFQRESGFPARIQDLREGWQPVDGIPPAALDSRGRLVDEAATIAAFELWRCSHWEDWKPASVDDLPPIDLSSTGVDSSADEGDDPFDQFEETNELSPPGTDEYLKRLSEWEEGFGTTSGKQLIEKGISLPAPDSLNDEELHRKLWQVIHGMAEANQFLYSTDHLSDRELYEYLWNHDMNELTMDLRGLSDCGYHVDLLGSGSDEETFLQHKYYAGAKERAHWMASFPDAEMPAHVDPPYDRDRHLPKRGAP